MKKLSLSLTAMVAVLALAACGKQEAPPAPTTTVETTTTTTAAVAVSVKQVVLAKAIDADKKALATLSSFAPADTIYAVLETAGVGKATLKAVWTFHKGDKVAIVNETAQDLTLAGPTQTEFHISNPGGWPVGDYQLEVFLNDASVNTQKFTVAQ